MALTHIEALELELKHALDMDARYDDEMTDSIGTRDLAELAQDGIDYLKNGTESRMLAGFFERIDREGSTLYQTVMGDEVFYDARSDVRDAVHRILESVEGGFRSQGKFFNTPEGDALRLLAQTYKTTPSNIVSLLKDNRRY